MRTVWTMGFVAAAALSFCFPDFIVFRFTQAVIWSIALLGLVILCGVSGQFSFAPAGFVGIGGWFYYDGIFTWPKSNLHFDAHTTYLKDGGTDWPKYAATVFEHK